MATYKQVSYGSKGSEVTELQKLLNQNGGYNLATDGIFGDKTKAAVTDYQKKNNLAVDGIVGENTWGALTKAQTQAAAPAETAPAQAPAFSYGDYKPSDTVAQAQALLQQQMAQKPGAYQSTWEGQLNDTINQILNREKFSYDVNRDALYQQYADQYTRQGKLAMMDTMGQAASLTGGYGSSYGQSVGQQAYQAYLQQLNEVVPELYGMALDQHNQEEQALYDQAALMAQQEDQDYSRYMDGLNAYLTERDYYTGRYDAERDYDYGKWADGRDFSYGQFIDERNMGYQQERDKVADQQWQAQFDEGKRQYEQSRADSMAKASASRSSSSSSNNSGTDTTYRKTDTEDDKYYAALFASVESQAELDALAQRMDAQGYDPDYINAFYNLYAGTFGPDIIDTDVPIVGNKGFGNRGYHGGGGGKFSYAVKN